MKHPVGNKRLAWFITIVVLLLLGSLAFSVLKFMRTAGAVARGISHCKQVELSLKQFSRDNGGRYPDSVPALRSGELPASANAAFLELIKAGILVDEQIFEAPFGLSPDGRLGDSPDFNLALQENENHWVLTAGQTDSSPGDMPLVFEHPFMNSWPPKWMPADFFGDKGYGPDRLNNGIIITRNDGSSAVVKMQKHEGMLIPKQDPQGKGLFTQMEHTLRILPVLLTPPAQHSSHSAR